MSATEVFFDTNVLLYLLSADSTKADRAEQVLAGGGVISVQVLNEFAAVAAGKFAMEIAEIRTVLAAMRAACSVHSLDVETHELGLEIAERYRYSVYDSMLLAAAIRAGCSIFYSEDLRHGQTIDSLRIVNPFEQ
ncbi:MAG TPA: PIN domain-containing protein [Xanthobacteraceae bacterium]|jgi:predicted nucleic acid-binding protein|nr:PIN domain-containing protein [Xanthobacteraceae bacterium]